MLASVAIHAATIRIRVANRLKYSMMMSVPPKTAAATLFAKDPASRPAAHNKAVMPTAPMAAPRITTRVGSRTSGNTRKMNQNSRKPLSSVAPSGATDKVSSHKGPSKCRRAPTV